MRRAEPGAAFRGGVIVKPAPAAIVIDATGSPAAGIRHALLCCRHRKHIVMVNVEADVLAGPLLARRAAQAGIIYSMASGDQPALIAEMVDWARTAGFEIVCAGKGTKYLPGYHQSTPARSGAITASARNRCDRATSTRRCSTPFSTAPSPRWKETMFRAEINLGDPVHEPLR